MKSTIYTAVNQKKPQILSKWKSAALTSFANHDGLKGRKPQGRFSDPIDYVVEKSTGDIFECLIKPENNVNLHDSLQEICRLIAIQENSPSEALNFIFELKQIIRDELQTEIDLDHWAMEIWNLDKYIDQIGLLAFNIYSDCRAQIYELRIDEIKRMYGRDAG